MMGIKSEYSDKIHLIDKPDVPYSLSSIMLNILSARLLRHLHSLQNLAVILQVFDTIH